MSQPNDGFQFDAICLAFEKAWSDSDTAPELAQFLNRADQRVRTDLFKRLVPIDLAYRKQRALPSGVEHYLTDFSDYASIVRELLSSVDTIEQNALVDGVAEGDNRMPPAVQVTGNQVPSGNGPIERSKIGRYTVLQLLGRGGQGAVYRAAHPTLPIEVAIKVARRKPSEHVRRAMQDEANVLCELDHPNVARIRDLDFDEHDCPYLVLELVRGRSLQQMLKTRDAPLHKAVGWLGSAADGVAYAHGRSVLHLDLKPGNIVVDEHGSAKVIDFGLARFRHAWDDQDAEPDRISGTPAYMAPEQASGSASDKTASADIFALGAILYRLITGSAPFAAETSEQALERSRTYDLDLSALDRSTAPLPLREACRRALACDPAARFETAEQFGDAIRQAVEPSSWTRNRRWATLAAIAGVLIVVASIWLWRASIDPDVGTALIDEFTVSHIGNTETVFEFEAQLLEARPPRERDDVELTAIFTTPVYCILVALNPDGGLQLCYPESHAMIQSKPIERLVFPAHPESVFRLTDGPGQQAFVLVASLEPLPSFADWKQAISDAPWPDPENEGNWEYKHGRIKPLVSSGPARGKKRGDIATKKMPASFKRICDQIYRKDTIDVRGVVFEVHPW